MARHNYFIEGNTKSEMALALGSLLKFSAEGGKQGLIVWPVLQTLHLGTLSDVLGDDTIKSLEKNRVLAFQGGASIKLVTWSTLPYSWEGPVLAAYPDRKTLDKIDGLFSVTHLIVNPWIPTDIEQWRRTWSPENLATGQAEPSDEPLSPVVQEALKALTSRVNLASGLGHPSDKAAAIDLFKILKSARFKLDSEAIKRWLMRNHWRPEDADEVRQLVQSINEGRTVRGRKASWRADIIEQFKERAENQD